MPVRRVDKDLRIPPPYYIIPSYRLRDTRLKFEKCIALNKTEDSRNLHFADGHCHARDEEGGMLRWWWLRHINISRRMDAGHAEPRPLTLHRREDWVRLKTQFHNFDCILSFETFEIYRTEENSLPLNTPPTWRTASTVRVTVFVIEEPR